MLPWHVRSTSAATPWPRWSSQSFLQLVRGSSFAALTPSKCSVSDSLLVRDNEKNRQVLLKLAESGRTLELRQDPKRPRVNYLVMKDASGWESSQHHGVIEFRK